MKTTILGHNQLKNKFLDQNRWKSVLPVKIDQNQLFRPKSTKTSFSGQNWLKQHFLAKINQSGFSAKNNQNRGFQSKSAETRFSDQTEVFQPTWTETKLSTWYPPIFRVPNLFFCLNLLLGLNLEVDVDVGVLPIYHQRDGHPLEQERIEHPQNRGYRLWSILAGKTGFGWFWPKNLVLVDSGRRPRFWSVVAEKTPSWPILIEKTGFSW